ncbi:MAG: discoidin domain-containing protein [Bacteroidaceae bacterium]|nr:discoidin domain-containing protein [Bacteroidaceae bacterium]
MPMSLAAVYNYVLEYANSILDDTAFGSHGLINSVAQLSTNAQEETEGPIANLLDSDFRTYFHSTWSAENPSENGFHNLQIDLGEPLDAVALKYSKRKGTGFMTDGSPLKVRVFATNTPEGEWNEVGVHRLSYTHATNNAVVGFKVIVLDNSYRYIRLQVEQTVSNANSHTYADNLFFNLSEFGAWEASFESWHAAYKNVPHVMIEPLEYALSDAKSELMAGNDNEATAKRLYTAFEAVKEYIPTSIEDVYENNDTHHSNLYYDLQGRIVEHPTRGIYIHNGKKVFIK